MAQSREATLNEWGMSGEWTYYHSYEWKLQLLAKQCRGRIWVQSELTLLHEPQTREATLNDHAEEYVGA